MRVNANTVGRLADINVIFTSYLGQTKLSLSELLNIKVGTVIDIDKQAGESVEIYVNDKILGRGEVMVYDQNLAIRINEILNSNSVIKYFKDET